MYSCLTVHTAVFLKTLLLWKLMPWWLASTFRTLEESSCLQCPEDDGAVPLRKASKSLPVDAAFHSGTLELILMDFKLFIRGHVSSVGIATDHRLDGPGIESWWGKFSAPLQTGPGAHPASCTMVTGSFPGVKSGQGLKLTSTPF